MADVGRKSELPPEELDADEVDVVAPGEADDLVQSPEDAEIEARARAQGWVPADEWDDAKAEREGRRRPRSFVTAREWVNNAENSMPLMRKTLRELSDKVTSQNRLLEDTHSFIREQRTASEQARLRAYERGKAEAKAEMRKAAEEGDIAAHDKAQGRYEAILEAERAPAPAVVQRPREPEAPRPNPETQQWVRDNPWFQADDRLKAAMIAEDSALVASRPDMDEYERLEMAASAVKRRYADVFDQMNGGPRAAARTVRPAAVSTPSGVRGNNSSTSVEARFARLPAEAKAAYDNYAKMFKTHNGTEYSKADYLKDYEVE